MHTIDTPASEALVMVQSLLRDYHPRDFALRMWDGTEWAAETGAPRFTLILRHPGSRRHERM